MLDQNIHTILYKAEIVCSPSYCKHAYLCLDHVISMLPHLTSQSQYVQPVMILELLEECVQS